MKCRACRSNLKRRWSIMVSTPERSLRGPFCPGCVPLEQIISADAIHAQKLPVDSNKQEFIG